MIIFVAIKHFTTIIENIGCSRYLLYQHLVYLAYNSQSDSTWKKEYLKVAVFPEGMVWVMKNNKYGFVDERDKLVILPEYDYVLDFSEGLAMAEKVRNMDILTRTTKSLFL